MIALWSRLAPAGVAPPPTTEVDVVVVVVALLLAEEESAMACQVHVAPKDSLRRPTLLLCALLDRNVDN